MKYSAFAILLFLAACGGPNGALYMAGFCLDDPTMAVPAHCQSFQQINAGDF